METEPPLVTLHGKIAGIDGLVRNALVVAEGECAMRLVGVQELATDSLEIIERLRSASSDWQPIATAPKNGAWFLGWNDDCGCFVWRDGPGLLTGEDPAPTHWMPLPDPPSIVSSPQDAQEPT